MYYIEDGKIKDHLLKKDDSFDTYLIRSLRYQWNYKILKEQMLFLVRSAFFPIKLDIF